MNFSLKMLTLVLFSSIMAQFDWQDNGVPIRQGNEVSWQRAAVESNDDAVIFAWSGTSTGSMDIWVQKVTADGQLLWGQDGIILAGGESRQLDPQLVSDGNGGAYVIWTDYQDWNEGFLYASHIDSEGMVDTAVWGEQGTQLALASIVDYTFSYALICSDGLGGAFVAWRDDNQFEAEHLTAEGPDHPEPGGAAVITTDNMPGTVVIHNAGSGFAVLSWTDDWGGDLFAQRIDTGLNTLWSTPEAGGLVICDASNSQRYPAIAAMNDTLTVFVWEDFRNDVYHSDLYIQVLNSDGSPLLSEDGELLCGAEGSQHNARVAADENGVYIVWQDKRDPIDVNWDDIYIQHWIFETGPEWDPYGIAVATVGKHKQSPRLTLDGCGGVYIVWEDERDESYPEVDIYLQHFTADGSISFMTDGLAISDADNRQYAPAVLATSGCDGMVLWGDWRTGSNAIYLQSVSQESGPALTANGELVVQGVSGDAQSPGVLYLGDNRSLVYWVDRRTGNESPSLMGRIVEVGYESQDYSEAAILETPTFYQTDPQAVKIEDKIIIFYQSVGDYGTSILFYQIFDLELNVLGEPGGFPVYTYEWQLDQQYFRAILGEDGYVYLAFSDFRFEEGWGYEIYVQKYDADGIAQWQDGGIHLTDFPETDDILIGLETLPEGGCAVLWIGGPWDELQLFMNAIDQNGDVPDEWSVLQLTENLSGPFSFRPVTTVTPYGYMIAWEDDQDGYSDIYGQLVSFSGEVMGDAGGFPVKEGANDQSRPAAAYNPVSGTVLVCWDDYESGIDLDINCRRIHPFNLTLEDDFQLSGEPGSNQRWPFIYTTKNGSELVIWEDQRNDNSGDLYIQILEYGESLINNGGIPLGNAALRQEHPVVSLFNNTENQYIVVWEDARSSGYEGIKNIYGQVITTAEHNCATGDVNGDSFLDILDLVITVSYIIGEQLFSEQQICAADVNQDATVDILDVMHMVNWLMQ